MSTFRRMFIRRRLFRICFVLSFLALRNCIRKLSSEMEKTKKSFFRLSQIRIPMKRYGSKLTLQLFQGQKHLVLPGVFVFLTALRCLTYHVIVPRKTIISSDSTEIILSYGLKVQRVIKLRIFN